MRFRPMPAVQIPVHRIETGFIRQRPFRLVINMMNHLAEHFTQRFGDLLSQMVHPHGMCLHHRRVAIYIDHEAGQTVALSVNEAIRVVVAAACQPEHPTHPTGRPYPFRPKRMINRHRLEREQTHGNASDLIVSDTEERPPGTVHFDQVAFTRFPFDMSNGTGENPRMKTQHRFLLLRLKVDFTVCHDSSDFNS